MRPTATHSARTLTKAAFHASVFEEFDPITVPACLIDGLVEAAALAAMACAIESECVDEDSYELSAWQTGPMPAAGMAVAGVELVVLLRGAVVDVAPWLVPHAPAITATATVAARTRPRR